MRTCKLFLIHGIGNEKSSSEQIVSTWLNSLKSAWARDGFDAGSLQIETAAAFYGDRLATLTQNWLKNELSIVDQGTDTEAPVDPAIITLYQEYEGALIDAGVAIPPEATDDETIEEMGFPHHKGVKRLARMIEAMSPENGNFLAKKFLPQAAAYIRRPGAASIIDEIVEAQLSQHLKDGPVPVLVAHSLGTVVTYRVLREAFTEKRFPLLLTLGSPLASEAIQKILPVPRLKPGNVEAWINAADARDFVALRHVLNVNTFGSADVRNLENIVNTQEDRHSIEGYLANSFISREIWNALSVASY